MMSQEAANIHEDIRRHRSSLVCMNSSLNGIKTVQLDITHEWVHRWWLDR
jgi:hypothetical protein